MNEFIQALSDWLRDYYLLATVLLAGVVLATRFVKQPVRRTAVHWATAVGLLLLALFCALPGWSVLHMTSRSPLEPIALAEHLEPTHKIAIQVADLPPSVQSPLVLPDEGSVDSAIPAASADIPIVVDMGTVFSCFVGLGSTVCALWLALGAWQVRRLRRQASPAPAAVRNVLSELASQLAKKPDIGISDQLVVAVAVGLRHPMVLLPRHLSTCAGPHDIRGVLAHELAHIRNRDLWLLAMVRCLLPILWMNPLYWLWRRNLRLDQETLADAAASDLTSQADYADQLVTWAKYVIAAQPPRFASSVGLWESSSQLKRRIAILLDGKLTVLRNCSRRWRVGSIVMLMVLATGLSLVTLQPESVAVEEPSTTERAEDEGFRFVRVVVSKGDRLTFEGRETTREALPKLLEAVSDRPNTVLEFAVVSEEISVRKLNELKQQMMMFAHEYGYKYSSYVGVHPLGSRGTNSAHNGKKSTSIRQTPTTSFGGKVEIVAIGTHGQQPQRWWDADGNPLKSVPFQWLQGNPNDVGGGGTDFSPQSLVRRFVLKVDSLPEDGRISWWKQQGIRGTTGAVIAIDGQPNPHGYKAQSIAFAKDQRTTDLRVGIAGSPWETRHKLSGSGYHGRNGKSVTLFAPEVIEGPIQVAVSHNYANQDYRVFAVDKQGNEHIQSGWGGRSSNGIVTAHASFPSLTAEDVDHYLFKVRDYQWVEFKDLPLAPKSSSTDHLESTKIPDMETELLSFIKLLRIATEKQILRVVKPNDAQPAFAIPSGLAVHAAYEFDPKNVLASVGNAFDEQAGTKDAFARVLEGLEKDPTGPRVNVHSDFVTHLTGKFAILGLESDASLAEATTLLLGIQTENSEALASVVDRFMRSDPQATQAAISGRRVWKIRDRQNRESFVCNELGHLFVTNDASLLKKVLRANVGRPNSDSVRPSNSSDTKKLPWSVQGRVTDMDGNGLADVEVRAATGMGTLTGGGTTSTDMDGNYQLSFGPGMRTQISEHAPRGVGVQAASIYASKVGWTEKNLCRQGDLLMTDLTPETIGDAAKNWGKKSLEEVVFADQPKTLNFTMQRAVILEGEFVETSRNWDVREQRFYITGPDLPPSSSVLTTVETDRKGRFEYQKLPIGYDWQFKMRVPKTAIDIQTETFQLDEPGRYRCNLVLDVEQESEDGVQMALRLKDLKRVDR